MARLVRQLPVLFAVIAMISILVMYRDSHIERLRAGIAKPDILGVHVEQRTVTEKTGLAVEKMPEQFTVFA